MTIMRSNAPACQRTHFVNPATGKVLGQEDGD